MADKLGQLLIRQNLINQKQLDEALKSQAIFGGRLGSQLVEAGQLDEIKLAQLLGQRHRVPYAHSLHFTKLTPQLLAALPKNLVEKYQVLPLKLEQKRLYLAMPDPGDLPAIEEVGFRTGYVIRPVVVPESVIAKQIKKLYGITRFRNFIQVEEEPTPRLQERPPEPAAADPATWLGGPEAESMMAAWEEANHVRTPQADPPDDNSPLNQLGEQLANHLDREVMADLIIKALAAEVDTAALFLIKGDTAFGWRAVQDGSAVPGYDLIQIGLDQPSILQTVNFTKSLFLGPAPDLPANQQILAPQKAEGQTLAVPIMLLGRLIGVVLVVNPQLELQHKLPDIRKVAAMLAIGLEMLILKNKLTSF